jgi:hypothetical protein
MLPSAMSPITQTVGASRGLWGRWKAVPHRWKVAILFWLWVSPLMLIIGGFALNSLWEWAAD